MYKLARGLLFRLDAELAHHLTLGVLTRFPAAAGLMAKPVPESKRLQTTLHHLQFPHPIGLAAGLDKDGVALHGLARCGFSFIEVGTVTPRPQPGNPTPRLFRLKEDEALINRMGFNNRGANELQRRLRDRPLRIPIGVNLGKNKDTPNALAVDDYIHGVEMLAGVADYLVINVSSPNTPLLRDLQSEAELIPLVQSVVAARNKACQQRPTAPPVLVKIAPDLSDDAIPALAYALAEAGCQGFIATNTTITRNGLISEWKAESGGLSGRPLRARSTDVIRLIHQSIEGRLPIIGSGGVFSASDAYEKIKAGCTLVEIYTAFIYKGPALIAKMVGELDKLLAKDGFERMSDAVGSESNMEKKSGLR